MRKSKFYRRERVVRWSNRFGRVQHVAGNKEYLMLVLSRLRDECIMIGDRIAVTIVDIRGDKVRLGIDAPSEIPVHRREVYEAIQRENLRAARIDPRDTVELRRYHSRPIRINRSS